MEEKEPHARVTIQMLYGKQLENERLLIELNAKLSNLDRIPERVSSLELAQAKNAWIERIAWVADGDNFYCWISGPVPGWWLNPNQSYPKPEGEHFWNGFAKEWQAPTLERPEGNYFWNVFTNEWVEIPAPPEAPTE